MNRTDSPAILPAAHDSFVAQDTPARLWSQIEQTLSIDIAEGRLRPGERLPPEHALAERFHVNRHTVRQALGSLASKGLVHVKHGRGSFVADFAVDYVLGKRTRFTENLAATGLTGARKVLESGELRAPAQISRALRLRPGAMLLRLLLLAQTRGRALSLAEHFFPAARVPGLLTAFERSHSISRALAACGVPDYTRARSQVSARMPDEQVAELLAQPAGRPVLYVESINLDSAGKPIEFSRVHFAGDLVQLVVEPGK